jgi:thymidylate synthase (FAD)
MEQNVAVLDHGYVKFVESWGSDERIIEAARMSTDKGFLGWGTNDKPGDERLLRYLYTHNHATPFEMAGMIIEVQAPIFVFREWHRHRTQSYNEMSARYIPLPDVNYMPTVERCFEVNAANKQANAVKGAEELTHKGVLDWLARLDEVYRHAEDVYQHGLRIGVPKEVARLPVPVGRYSRMRACANLRNWLAFMTLRMAPNAQKEIRLFANVVGQMVEKQFPRTYRLFDEQFQKLVEAK